MSAVRQYYYNEQLRRYLIQFMAIFADLQVMVGANEDKSPRYVSTPIYGTSKDRVVGMIKGGFTQNKPIRLPAMSAHLASISMAPQRRHGVQGNRRTPFMPYGGLFPDGVKVSEMRMPVPYDTMFNLNIWASNQYQHHQLLEQILMVFDPLIQIQTSDELFDWTKLTTVELDSIGLQENVPIGGDRRIITTELTFKVPIWISVPADVHSRFVKDIFIRVGAVSASTSLTDGYEIVAELDEQGIQYEKLFSLDDIDVT